MGKSLRITARRVFVGNKPVRLLARTARKPTQSKRALDQQAADIGATILHSVSLRANEVIE